jgi:nucleoid DNA-binding protein
VRKALIGLALLLGLLALTADAQVLPRQRKIAPDLKAAIVRDTKLKEPTVEKVLKALPDGVIEQITAGRAVTIEGLGTFQVVRIDAYEDLVQGKPTLIPARNYIEFVPSDQLNQAANAPGAVPARTVKGYEFRVLPNANPGIKTEGRRTPGTRIR